MWRRRGVRQQEAETLAFPLEFELERAGARTRGVLALLILFTIVSVAVLAYAPIRSVVVAVGVVKPQGEPTAVHHDYGGPVARLHAARGARVLEGAPILTLDKTSLSSEVAELARRQAALALTAERVSALLDGRAPRFDMLADGAAPIDGEIAAESARFESERVAIDTETATFEAERDTLSATIRAAEEEGAAVAQAIEALRERWTIVSQLVERKALSRVELLELTSRLSDAEARLAAIEGEAAEARRRRIESERRLRSRLAERRVAWARELTEARSELSAVAEQIARRRDALEKRTVRAPVDGYVLTLGAGGPGAVVRPGDLVAEIVPADRSLVAEVRISPSEIAHVAVGDEARLHVETLDPDAVGDVLGVVTMISPSAIVSPEGDAYYTAEIDLTDALAAPRSVDLSLLPGMNLTANILGDERTVLGYLTAPFKRAWRTAFTEV